MIFFAFCACSDEKSASIDKENTVYATVNGEELTTEEIDYFKGRCKAEVINEYAEKYNITDFSEFWDKEFDGTTPAEYLEKKAFECAVQAKVKLILMKENGIYEDISYSALRKKAQDYNDSNKNKKGNVGLNSISIDGFYTYYISNGEMKLKNILSEKENMTNEEYEMYIGNLTDKAEIVIRK